MQGNNCNCSNTKLQTQFPGNPISLPESSDFAFPSWTTGHLRLKKYIFWQKILGLARIYIFSPKWPVVIGKII